MPKGTLKLVGHQDDDFFDIDSGKDHIILLRATGSFGMSMQMGFMPKKSSDAEMVRAAKQSQKKSLGNGISYWQSLTANGGCIVFENAGEQALKVTVDITGSSNLRIDQGESMNKKTV